MFFACRSISYSRINILDSSLESTKETHRYSETMAVKMEIKLYLERQHFLLTVPHSLVNI